MRPKSAVQEVAGKVVAERSFGASILKARFDRVVASSVEANGAAGFIRATFRLELDDTRGSVTVLGGKRSRDEAHLVDESRVDDLPEACDALRQEHAVEAILQVRVVAPHVQLSKGILGNARRLEEHLIELGAFPLGLCFDGIVCDLIDAASSARRDLVASHVKLLADDAHVKRLARGEYEISRGFRTLMDSHDHRGGFEIGLVALNGVDPRRNVFKPETAVGSACRLSHGPPVGGLEP